MLLAACGGGNVEQKKESAKKAPPEKPPELYKVKLDTTKGAIVIQVTRAWAPRGADQFYSLVRERFYDGVKFHRVRRDFIAQFGINGDPKVNRLWAQLQIPDDPPKEKNRRGTVAFAKLGANTRSTQVFFNLRNNPELDSTGFVPFGKVVEGLEVIGELTSFYGELAPRGPGPDPAKIHLEGNAYLDRGFPRLDAIKTAAVVP
ncbi:MAG: peptidylprolyl isomerase [Acidobacteria bacterium]|nr:peptidylprolyl isomerase [Acidobacteriota bacterium]